MGPIPRDDMNVNSTCPMTWLTAEEGGRGVWDPKNPPDVPSCKFRLFPRQSLWSGGGGVHRVYGVHTGRRVWAHAYKLLQAVHNVCRADNTRSRSETYQIEYPSAHPYQIAYEASVVKVIQVASGRDALEERRGVVGGGGGVGRNALLLWSHDPGTKGAGKFFQAKSSCVKGTEENFASNSGRGGGGVWPAPDPWPHHLKEEGGGGGLLLWLLAVLIHPWPRVPTTAHKLLAEQPSCRTRGPFSAAAV